MIDKPLAQKPDITIKKEKEIKLEQNLPKNKVDKGFNLDLGGSAKSDNDFESF